MENQAITSLLTSSKDKHSSLNSNKRLKILIAKKRPTTSTIRRDQLIYVICFDFDATQFSLNRAWKWSTVSQFVEAFVVIVFDELMKTQ